MLLVVPCTPDPDSFCAQLLYCYCYRIELPTQFANVRNGKVDIHKHITQ